MRLALWGCPGRSASGLLCRHGLGALAGTLAFASDLFQSTGAAAGTIQLTFTLDGLVADLPSNLET